MTAQKLQKLATRRTEYYPLKLQSQRCCLRFERNAQRGAERMGFSAKQEALVKESWELMKQNVTHLSLRFFTLILEIAPVAKGMFSFLKDTDEIPENNPRLKAHALRVFKMTCESAVQLREKGEVAVADTTLKYLGSVHLQKGVIEPHFEIVKEALLRTVKEAMGEKWSEEMNDAWGEAYDQLAAAIKAEMQAEAAAISANAVS